MSNYIQKNNLFVEAAVSLGEKIYTAWAEKNYVSGLLAGIATEALKESRIHEKFNFDEFVSYFCKLRELPEQIYPKDGFGKPSITLFRRGGLAVDMYFWDHVDTNIHSHGFCGAFSPIYGKSLHSEYSFTASEGDLGRDQVVIGELNLLDCNIANTGEVFAINEGNSFIHQVIHFETPTVTFLVRNTGSASVKQYNYKDGIAYIHAANPIISLKHSNLLKLLARMKHPNGSLYLKSIIEECLKNRDRHLAVKFLFDNYFQFLEFSDAENFIAGISGFLNWQAQLVKALREAEDKRVDYSRIHSKDSRFVVSAMLAAKSWYDLQKLIKQYVPEANPKDFVMDKISNLLSNGALPVRLNEVALNIFSLLFYGKSDEQIFQEIISRFDVSDNQEVRTDINNTKSQISSSKIFRALL